MGNFRYVKEFDHPASFGFTGSAGKAQAHARGGSIKSDVGGSKHPNIGTSPAGKGSTHIKTAPVGSKHVHYYAKGGKVTPVPYARGGSAHTTPDPYKKGGAARVEARSMQGHKDLEEDKALIKREVKGSALKFAKGGRVKGDPKDSSEEKGSRREYTADRKEMREADADEHGGVTRKAKGGIVKGDPRDASEEKGSRREFTMDRKEARAADRDERGGVTAKAKGGRVKGDPKDSSEERGSRREYAPTRKELSAVERDAKRGVMPKAKGGKVHDKNAVKPDHHAVRVNEKNVKVPGQYAKGGKVTPVPFAKGGCAKTTEFTFKKGGRVWKARPHDDEEENGPMIPSSPERDVAAASGGRIQKAITNEATRGMGHLNNGNPHEARGHTGRDRTNGIDIDVDTSRHVLQSSNPFQPDSDRYPGRPHFASGGHMPKGGAGLGHPHMPKGAGGRHMGALGMAAGPLMAGLGAPPGGAAGAPQPLGGGMGAPPGAPPGMPMGGRPPMGPPMGHPMGGPPGMPPGMGRPPGM